MASPLYVAGVNISGQVRNAVYVATQHNSVYAFDAEATAQSAQTFWKVHLAQPVPKNSVEGVRPQIGILSTPVIDSTTSTIYLVAEEFGKSTPFWLHALDVTTGAEKFGGPVAVTGSVSGTGLDSSGGTITLEPTCFQRMGLALNPVTNAIYIPFGTCNHGWILAYDKQTLMQTAVFNDTPDGGGGGLGGSGGAPAIDATTGDLFLMSGVDAGDEAYPQLLYNDSFLRLNPTDLSVLDFFAPDNNLFLAQNDADLGSGANILLPGSSSFPHETVGGGKDGNIFVVRSEGGEARRIVKGRRPTWGVNSQAIIYSNDEPGKNNSLWQIPFSTTDGTASGAPEPLTVGRGRDTQAAISRDGNLIAFAAQDLSFNIETLPFDAEMGRQTGTPQEVTRGSNNIDFLSFSPDGRSIVFQSHGGARSHIWRVEVGSAPVQLTSDPNFNDSKPRWSPDAQSIAFIRRPVGVSQQPATPGAPSSLWLMSEDGANPRLLSENAGNPHWAPSGLALVYGSVAEGRQNQLFIFDLATKTSRRLTNERAVVPESAFSPDGKWLIYQSNQSGNVDLRAVPIEGGESRSVVATPHQDYHPFVSPSGKWLYFQLDHKNIYRVPGPAQEWRKGEPEKVTNFPESGLFLEDPQISRDGHWLLYSRGRITGDVWIMNLGK